jgi:hypothetical protein
VEEKEGKSEREKRIDIRKGKREEEKYKQRKKKTNT